MIYELFSLSQPIINALGWTLIHSIWQGSMIAIFLAIFFSIYKKSPRIKYVVSLFALILIQALALCTFSFYYARNTETNAHSVPVFINSLIDVEVNATTYISLIDKLKLAIDEYSSLIVMIWLAGIFILLIRLAGGLYYTKKLRSSGLITIENNIIHLVSKFSRICHLKRKIKIFESVLVNVPVTIGYLRPYILLPLGTIAGIPPGQVEAIIAHEIAHIKRHDSLLNLVTAIIEIIFFYHPAIWWISEKINEERENCCDDIAIKLTGNSTELVRALAGLNQTFTHPKHILAMTGKKNRLLERIKRLAGIKEKNREFSFQSFSFIIISFIAACIAFSVNASVQIPDNLLKTSLSTTVNNDFINQYQEPILQDTLKLKKKKSKPSNNPAKATTGEVKQKNGLSDEQKEKLKAEMKKLEAEMKKLEKEMKELHKQLGTKEWNNFDFKFNFDMDSIKVNFNDFYRKMDRTYWDKMDFKFYFDKDSLRIIKDDAREIFENRRGDVEKARANSEAARVKPRAYTERAIAESKKANANVIIIQKDMETRLREREESRALIRAKNFRIKAETNSIEEELRKDGLISGDHYTLKIDNKEMMLDGKKQSEDVYRKYVDLIMSDLEDDNGNSMDDKQFNIQISK